jgi:hypothetical protein
MASLPTSSPMRVRDITLSLIVLLKLNESLFLVVNSRPFKFVKGFFDNVGWLFLRDLVIGYPV